jgi:predicted Zn-dependent protease
VRDREGIHAAVQIGLRTLFVSAGVIGILGSLTAPARSTNPSASLVADSSIALHAHRRVELLQRQLRQTPRATELHARLARAYVARATARAHEAYSRAFPEAFLAAPPLDQFESWRRGCFRRDPDLRRALHHARSALAARPPTLLRVRALHLVAEVEGQRNGAGASIPPLREIVRLAPGDTHAWTLLAEAYRERRDLSRYRDARRRLDALEARWPTLAILARARV